MIFCSHQWRSLSFIQWPISPGLYEFINEIFTFFTLILMFKSHIVCTCHDSWAVVIYVKSWTVSIIILSRNGNLEFWQNSDYQSINSLSNGSYDFVSIQTPALRVRGFLSLRLDCTNPPINIILFRFIMFRPLVSESFGIRACIEWWLWRNMMNCI